MLTQVISAVFRLMETNREHWMHVGNSSPVLRFGFEYTVGLEPVRVNVERMVSRFQSGVRELSAIWRQVLAQETYEEIRRLNGQASTDFRFPPDLWVRTVYDFAVAYHTMAFNREHLLQSLTPLYLGRTASFVLETLEADAEEVERILEHLCQEYERWKPYLVERWNSS
jgi:hypothetical protein